MPDNVFIDYYRCPERYGTTLPFEADAVIDHLRLERFMNAGQSHGTLSRIARNIYYGLRPLMGVTVRKHLQRAYLRGWEQITFPRWPVDRTVDCIFESLVTLGLELRGETRMPFVWFWPQGYSGSLILTHDIETAAGRDFAPTLADIDASFGFKSSFQIVPEDRYEVTESFLEALRSRGCEINLHGLNHDGRDFENRSIFLERVAKINRYARQFGAAGFRSPVLYRNVDWYGDFEFSYDMSIPNCGHLDPQRGGCCTVMPYFIGDILELPLTMTQDYSLFHYLNTTSIELWKQQIELVLEKHGLISFNIHPDYIIEDTYRDVYYRLLEHLQKVCHERNVWIALPGEVNEWWRQRRSGSESAVPAYAEYASGHLQLRRSEWQAKVPQAA